MANHTPEDIRILCDAEFGDHEHDNVTCAEMLGTMGLFDDQGADDFDYMAIDYPSYDPDGDFYAATGRMPFPNEY